jgi:hypothetical protein
MALESFPTGYAYLEEARFEDNDPLQAECEGG